MGNRKIDFEKDFLEFTDEEESAFQTQGDKEDTTEQDKGRILTEEEVVAKKYRLGMSVQQIRKEHDISFGKVYEILAKKDVPLRNGRYRSKSNDRISMMTELEKQSLIADYKGGMQIEQIYKKYDINKHGCYIILDEANVPRRLDRTPEKSPIPEMVENIKVKSSEDTAKTLKIKSPAIMEISRDGDILNINVTKQRENPIDFVNVSFKLEDDE